MVENSDALLLAWYPGTEGGTAIAETILGINNPGGKLPISFPRAEGAIPCYYHQLVKRPNYVDVEGTPYYSFGHGLSYTRFTVSRPELHGNTVSVSVTNVGDRDGDDVIQLYIRDVIFSVARPLHELRGFQRISLAAGETKKVTFTLTEKELGFWNRKQEYVVEPGDFKIWVVDDFADDILSGQAKPVNFTFMTGNCTSSIGSTVGPAVSTY